MKTKFLLLFFMMFFAVANFAGTKDSIQVKSLEREKFDPNRDAKADIKNAVEKAYAENKNILLDVGGEWCIWCRRLDNFFLENSDLNDFLHKNFIVVKVNFSPENENKEVLSKYPVIEGYPHFFVLNKKGELIHSQNTGELEEGKGYSKDKIFDFLKNWAPGKTELSN